MNGAINVKSPNNTSKWQLGFNSAFKGLKNDRHQNYEKYVLAEVGFTRLFERLMFA
jgi:hypothetical protein